MQDITNAQDENETINPIDNVEEILTANNWHFTRASDDELMVEVSGKQSKYQVFFIWQEDLNALQFGCHYNLEIPENNLDEAHAAILSMNENLWLGHFDLPSKSRTPIFRHTSLMRSAGRSAASEIIEDMVEVSLLQCERFYPLFQLLSQTELVIDTQNLSLAMMETAGNS